MGDVLDWGSHAAHPGVLPISDQKALILSAFCVHTLSTHLKFLAVVSWRMCRRRYCWTCLLSFPFHRYWRSNVHFHIKILLRGPTRCSSAKASRRHQLPLIHLFVSLAALTSWSGITAKIDSPNTHKVHAYGAPDKYWTGVLPSGRTVSKNPA